MPTRIGILGGTGRMGGGLARGYAKAGHQVFLGSRTPKRAQQAAMQVEGDLCGGSLGEAAQGSEIIVVAVPFGDAASTVGALSAALAGKVVVDITNPFGAVPPEQISGIEFNARAAGSARWVAAYKTTFWKTLDEPQLADGTKRDVLVCSDDRQAKQTVIALIEQTGFRAVDCGQLENARTLDLMVPLMIELDGRYQRHATSSWKFFDSP